MNAIRYTKILEAGLLPLIQEKFEGGHRFQQDNDPKHVSRFARNFFEEKGINWFKTPPESPDLNPIENVWGSMKQFLRNEYKPTNLEDLKKGIRTFWKRMTPTVCSDYIAHIQKVMVKVIEVQGEPSGYYAMYTRITVVSMIILQIHTYHFSLYFDQSINHTAYQLYEINDKYIIVNQTYPVAAYTYVQ